MVRSTIGYALEALIKNSPAKSERLIRLDY